MTAKTDGFQLITLTSRVVFDALCGVTEMSYPATLKTLARRVPVLRDLVAQRDLLLHERDALLHQRHALRQEADALRQERDALRQQADALLQERDALGHERDRFQKEVEITTAEVLNLRRDCSRLLVLEPKFLARNKEEFLASIKTANFSALQKTMQGYLASVTEGREFFATQFCLCCNKTTSMLVDYQYAEDERLPNWRERLVCPECNLNNRQRLVAKLVQQHIEKMGDPTVYCMEQITPLFEWIKLNYREIEIYGSEYLGYEQKAGTVINGIRHEDVMNMSFKNNSIDLIVSNDVLEHVPDFRKGLAECARILKPGGLMLTTIPFYADRDKSQVRAIIENDVVKFLMPAQFHGNPLSKDGCLVFHDFGWDVLDVFSESGFCSVICELYADDRFGHFGEGQIVFKAQR